ncbi:MAG: NUDIX domain-containing protein [Candidatus Aenigmarchaeota archaeon]|nr:NUDIX domain-containing protein [Candidatus Aenigmarchaeota archaeon]
MKEKSVGGIVFRKEGRKILYLLLLYERKSDGLRTYWDFPKGHQEKGESEEETLAREVAEETSIKDISVARGFRHTVKYFFRRDGKTVQKEVAFYLCKTVQKDVKISSEHKDSAWLDYDGAMKKLAFDNSKGLLKKAGSFLSRLTLKDF